MEEYKDQLPKEEVEELKTEIDNVRKVLENKETENADTLREAYQQLQQKSLKLFELAYKKMAADREGSSGSSGSSEGGSSEESK